MGDQGALALDDWGSGYSNSNSLLELSPDYIKGGYHHYLRY